MTPVFEASVAFGDVAGRPAAALRRKHTWPAWASVSFLALAGAAGAALTAAGLSPGPVLLLLGAAGYFAWWAELASGGRRAGVDNSTGLPERSALLLQGQAGERVLGKPARIRSD